MNTRHDPAARAMRRWAMRSADPSDRTELRVLLLTDPEEVHRRAAGLFAADPIGTNVAATVLAVALGGRPQPAGSFWALVENADGRAVALAMGTAGFPVFLTPMPDGTAELIAEHLAAAVPG